jgi:hypothetical protein
MHTAYDEIIDIIATGPSCEQVASFEASPQIKQRIADLVRREKTTGLSEEETVELDRYVTLEHIMRLAKAKARARLRPAREGNGEGGPNGADRAPSDAGERSAFDEARDLGLIGVVKDAPADLSTNERHFEGFGRD